MGKNMEVATRIKNIRLNRGLTLEEFGEILGATKVSVHNWESGRNLPNKKRLKQIAEIGEVSIDYLLEGKMTFDDLDEEQKKYLMRKRKQYDDKYLKGIRKTYADLIEEEYFEKITSDEQKALLVEGYRFMEKNNKNSEAISKLSWYIRNLNTISNTANNQNDLEKARKILLVEFEELFDQLNSTN